LALLQETNHLSDSFIFLGHGCSPKQGARQDLTITARAALRSVVRPLAAVKTETAPTFENSLDCARLLLLTCAARRGRNRATETNPDAANQTICGSNSTVSDQWCRCVTTGRRNQRKPMCLVQTRHACRSFAPNGLRRRDPPARTGCNSRESRGKNLTTGADKFRPLLTKKGPLGLRN
jgi:hypothetical protein